jgi:uncharacterized membrane protein YagU involved in acid resistance
MAARDPMDPRSPTLDRPVRWSAVAYAGIAAGILSTIVQIVLWFVFTDALPAILFRDARFTAAIVMGRGALSPLETFDVQVMLVATLVHFALSVAYGLILSRLIARLRTTSSLLVGAVFGLCLYIVNMHGFTIFFPWFDATRDWITVVAHVIFGVTAAAAYKALST